MEEEQEAVRVANKAVAACLRMLSTGEQWDVDVDEVLLMLSRVLMHPEILV